jgi:hypothetical protein
MKSEDLLGNQGIPSYSGVRPGVDSTVKGVINHYGITDVRKDTAYITALGLPAETYPFPAFYISRYAGVKTKNQLNILPLHVTQNMSLLYFLENASTLGLKDRLTPMYQFFERNGAPRSGTDETGGAVTYPCPDPSSHAEQYMFLVEQEMARQGMYRQMRYCLPRPTDVTDGGAPMTSLGGVADTRTIQQAVADDMLLWAAECVTPGREIRGGRAPIYWRDPKSLVDGIVYGSNDAAGVPVPPPTIYAS